MSAEASASPSTSVIVVDVMGAEGIGPASRSGGRTSSASERRPSEERRREVTPTSGTPKRRQ